jgi:hypothetical protein
LAKCSARKIRPMISMGDVSRPGHSRARPRRGACADCRQVRAVMTGAQDSHGVIAVLAGGVDQAKGRS